MSNVIRDIVTGFIYLQYIKDLLNIPEIKRHREWIYVLNNNVDSIYVEIEPVGHVDRWSCSMQVGIFENE